MKSILAKTSILTIIIALGACTQSDKTETTAEKTAVEQSVEKSDALSVSAAELKGNPFTADWTTPYGVPPFSKIKDSDYMPAIKAGALALREEIDAIVNNPDAPTFKNTIVALDKAGKDLSKSAGTFGNVVGTDTNDTLRALQGQIFPLITRESNKIQFNEALFDRVKSVYAKKDTLGLDEQDARLLELTYRDFVRAGANLDTDSKARVAAINEELSSLTTSFGQNLLKATTGFKLEITDPDDLGGLSDSFKSAIKVKNEEKWVVGLNRSPYETFMTQSTNRDLRKKLFNGYRLRASSGDIDNGPIAIKIAQLRAERARILGYKSHAEYQLETRMAKTPEGAEEFLLRVWRPGLARAKEELADIQSLIDAEGHDFKAEGQDWLVRKCR